MLHGWLSLWLAIFIFFYNWDLRIVSTVKNMNIMNITHFHIDAPPLQLHICVPIVRVQFFLARVSLLPYMASKFWLNSLEEWEYWEKRQRKTSEVIFPTKYNFRGTSWVFAKIDSTWLQLIGEPGLLGLALDYQSFAENIKYLQRLSIILQRMIFLFTN